MTRTIPFALLAGAALVACSGTPGSLATPALPAAAVSARTVAITAVAQSSAATGPLVPAIPAGAFVTSTGVNVHSGYYNTAYTNNESQYQSIAENLGVGFLRDGLYDTDSYVTGVHQKLVAAGLKLESGNGSSTDESHIDKFVSAIGLANIYGFEGPNEPDLSNDSNWVAHTIAAQKALYADVHTKYPSLKILTPSVTTEGAAQQLGDLTAYATNGNSHIYFVGNRNPETPPFGNNGYGSFMYGLNVSLPISGKEPIVITESGIDGSGNAPGHDYSTQAKYVLRDRLLAANDGAAAFVYYELLTMASTRSAGARSSTRVIM